jgi:hypothetical protein
MPTATFGAFSPLLSIPTQNSLHPPDRRHLVQTETSPTLMCGGVDLGNLAMCHRVQENLTFHVDIIDEANGVAVIEYDVVAANGPSGSADSPCRLSVTISRCVNPCFSETVVATTVVPRFKQAILSLRGDAMSVVILGR